MPEFTTLETKLGQIKGLAAEDYNIFYSIPFATAKRFEYATPIDHWDGILDATTHGPVMTQYRTFNAHLDIPERLFYYNEFRDGIDYKYEEDALNLNIFAPKDKQNCPVVVYIHGGGFNSGGNYDTAIHGEAYAQKGIVCVIIQYRLGPLGYIAHEDLVGRNDGREGNFGLDDQFLALSWVKHHIADFGGDPENITAMGQSAGAISIQIMCLSAKWNGLFQHVIMMSGAGKFPKFAQPKPAADCREYWLDVMTTAGCSTFDEFKELPVDQLFAAWENVRSRRKDNQFNCMPMIDNYYLTDTVTNLIANPLPVDYMIGYTNNDMYAPILAAIGNSFGKKNSAFLYFFDIDAPGDGNKAFHSSDIRYMFGTFSDSSRPYDDADREVSRMMMQYVINFATNGNPNLPGKQDLPVWKNNGKAMHFTKDIKNIRMGKANLFALAHNWLKIGDPK